MLLSSTFCPTSEKKKRAFDIELVPNGPASPTSRGLLRLIHRHKKVGSEHFGLSTGFLQRSRGGFIDHLLKDFNSIHGHQSFL